MRTIATAMILLVVCCGCNKEKASETSEGGYDIGDWFDEDLADSPIYAPAADGTIYAAVNFGGDNPQILWLVGTKAVAVDASGLHPSYLDDAAADLHGGLYIRGPESLWYLKDGRALETTMVGRADIRPDEHVVTPHAQHWVATRRAAERLHADISGEAWNEGWDYGNAAADEDP